MKSNKQSKILNKGHKMSKPIFLYFKESKIKFIDKKRRNRKLLRMLVCNIHKVRFIGKAHFEERQKRWIQNSIINIILKNKNHYIMTANKEIVLEKYKNRQNNLKRKNKHLFVTKKSQEMM